MGTPVSGRGAADTSSKEIIKYRYKESKGREY